MYIPNTPFTQNDWDHLSSCWLTVKHTKLSHEELESLFQLLPNYIQHLGDQHGMNDTVFRDEVIQWLSEN
jgi:hypothetical protein